MTLPSTFPFTQKRINELNAVDKTKTYSDKKLSTLKLTITARGSKTYYARFKSAGQSHNIKIGNGAKVDLDEARSRVVELLNLYGKSGATVLRNVEEGNIRRYTVNKAFSSYYRNHLKFTSRKGNQRYSLELNYTNHLKPIIGDIEVVSLSKKALAKTLKRIGQNTSPAIYIKCVIELKAIIDYCLEYEDDFPIAFNPAISLKKISLESRSRYLTYSGVERLVCELRKLDHPVYTNLFLLALLTGSRMSNVKSMRWDEVIFDDGMWIVPSIKTKSRKTYYLPLSNLAQDVLRRRFVTFRLPVSNPFSFDKRPRRWGILCLEKSNSGERST